jgi:hypothetical protein
MSSNLVSLIMQFLTPDMVGRIATALGFNRNSTQSAVSAAIPGLLAALSNTASQPGGAQKIADAAKQQTGTLGNLAAVLATGAPSSIVEKGSQMLAALVGDQDQNALAGAIAKYTGLGQSASASLLGLLAPIVMGTVAQQQGSARAIDANGIANLFAAQKNNIAAALPSEFSGLLSSTGLLRTATAAGSETARAAASTARAVSQTGQRSAASTNWLYWLVPIAAAAALFIYLGGRQASQTVQQGMNQTASQAQSLGEQVTTSLTSLRTTLNGITDVSSAQAALPKLQAVTAQIDKVGAGIGQLSPDQRKILADLVNPVMPSLNQLCDKVLAVPGVAEVLRPSVDAVKTKLTALVA